MFIEKNTEALILKRMLDKIPSDLDKREGSSIIYNALAPVALELAQAYSNLDRNLGYAFINEDTPEMFIENRASEIGLKRYQPTRAIRKGIFYKDNVLMDIPLNSRFYIEGINFKAIEKMETGIYKMECEQVGSVGNNLTGTLIPVDYIEGLTKAELKDLLIPGIDLEPKEDLYSRIESKEQEPSTSGNVNDYKKWALEVSGVGKCKPFPLWAGEGTMKVVITDNFKKTPSEELIKKVYTHIEELRPIGAKITVKGALEKKIYIFAKVVLIGGANISQVQENFINLLDKYLKGLAFEATSISIAKVGNILLNTPGVLDYTELKINNDIVNINLTDEEIPILDKVVLGV